MPIITKQVAQHVSLEFGLEPPITHLTVLGLMDNLTYDVTKAMLQERYGRELAESVADAVLRRVQV